MGVVLTRDEQERLSRRDKQWRECSLTKNRIFLTDQLVKLRKKLKQYRTKREKESILGRCRQLERQLGVTPQLYNHHSE